MRLVSSSDYCSYPVGVKVSLRSSHDSDIARLAIPALGSLIAEPVYVLVDTAIVGRIGTIELAGLALASNALLSVHATLIFLTYGTTATVSRLMGSNRTTEAANQALQGLWLALFLGLPMATGLYWFAEPILVLFGGSGPALDAGLTYLEISVIGFPFMLIAMAGAGGFTGRQDTKTPLQITVLAAGFNLILELILINGFGYGIGASALSTVIAQLGAAMAFVFKMVQWAGESSVQIRPDFKLIAALGYAGRSLILRALALRGAFSLAAAVAARLGTTTLAAYQISTQLWVTLALALDAIAIAGQALTGSFLGAGDELRAKSAARRMIQLDVVMGVCAGVVMIAGRHWLASLFSPDPDVLTATAIAIIWVGAMAPISGYVFALDGILIGAGDMKYLGRTMVVAFAGFAICAWLITGNDFDYPQGLSWLWAAITAFIILRAVFLWQRWRSDRWIVLG